MRNQATVELWHLDSATALRIVALTVLTALVAAGVVPLLALLLLTFAAVAHGHVELRALVA